MIRVTIWNENIHEREMPEAKAMHPQGIHGTLAAFLSQYDDLEIHTATLDEPDCGLPDSVLDNTDVLLWWGHMAHDKVPDELAQKVQEHVLKGMGLIVLHSAHYSKPFTRLMGTSCSLRWRDGEYERVWCVNPGHPIAEGIPPCFELSAESSLIFLSRTSWSLPAGSAAVRFSDQAAAGAAGWARFSISSPAMKPIPPTTIPMCKRLSPTRFIGPRPATAVRRSTVITTLLWKKWSARDRISAGIDFFIIIVESTRLCQKAGAFTIFRNCKRRKPSPRGGSRMRCCTRNVNDTACILR